MSYYLDTTIFEGKVSSNESFAALLSFLLKWKSIPIRVIDYFCIAFIVSSYDSISYSFCNNS